MAKQEKEAILEVQRYILCEKIQVVQLKGLLYSISVSTVQRYIFALTWSTSILAKLQFLPIAANTRSQKAKGIELYKQFVVAAAVYKEEVVAKSIGKDALFLHHKKVFPVWS